MLEPSASGGTGGNVAFTVRYVPLHVEPLLSEKPVEREHKFALAEQEGSDVAGIQPDRGVQRPILAQARELRSVYYDAETQMFREPWHSLDYGVLKFWRWRVETGQLVGDGPVYGRLADREFTRGWYR